MDYQVNLDPIWVQRAELGLSTPLPDEKRETWSQLTIPQARISRETGGYKPFRIIDRAHDHPARIVLVAGGIRGSKSVSAAAEAIAWAPHSSLIWFGADTYDLARMEFEYCAEGLLSLGWTLPRLVNMPTNIFHPCSLETIWGTVIATRTLHDVNTFVAQAPDLIVICEPGLANEQSLQRARERTSTKRGRIYLPGTFEEVKGQWMERMWRKWVRWPNEDNAKSFTVPSWMNRTIFPKGKHDPEIAALRRACKDLDEFLRRVVGVPSKMPDLVFGQDYSVKLHLGKVEWLRRDSQNQPHPVYLAVDPGYSDGHYVVLAIQVIDGLVRVFDEVDMSHETHGTVIQAASFKEWWPFAMSGTMDPHAGDKHIFGSVSPQSEWWQRSRINLTLPQQLHVEELIRLIQGYLRDPVSGKPRLVIDEDKCPRLTHELSVWRRKKANDGVGIPSKSNCDAIKALGYFLTWLASHQGNLSLRDTTVIAPLTFR